MKLRKEIRTILESVLVESEGKSVTCQNCFHHWDIKKTDDSPYFCHICGYDNKEKEFDLDKLKKWMKKHYQLNESLDSNKVFSGKEVNRHIELITPNQEDLPDWFMDELIKPRKFKIQKVDLNQLLNTDSDFAEYYNEGDFEDRYEYDDLDSEGLNQELVVVDGQLLDGYNRASMLLSKGEDYAEAFVALPK